MHDATTKYSAEKHQETIETHLLRYLKDFQELQRVADEVERYLISVLEEQTIKHHLVEARAKSFESYRAKSQKARPDRTRKYRDLPTDIHDCVAARVIVYTTDDRDSTVNELRKRFDVLPGEDRNPGKERTEPYEAGWGYDSHHFVVQGLRDSDSGPVALGRYLSEGRSFEVQVRTVAAHAWAEYEHDVRYKPERLESVSAESKGKIQVLFKNAADARQAIDAAFTDIEKLLREGRNQSSHEWPAQGDEGPKPVVPASAGELTSESVKSFLAANYPEARVSKDPAIDWMKRVVNAAAITTTQQLSQALEPVDSIRVAELMDYQTEPTRIRRLDDDLLSALGEVYIERTAAVADNENAKERRQRYLPARHSRLSGKLRIYEIIEASLHGTKQNSPLTTAAGAVRSLISLVLEQRGQAEAALLEGYIGTGNDGFLASDHTTLWEFHTGHELWVHGRLSRSDAEYVMKQLVDRLDPHSVQVRRSGDLLFGDQ